MDTFRRIRYAVTLLILVMALFVAAETAMLNVWAASGGTLTLHGGQGNPAGTGYYSPSKYGHAFTGEDVGVFGSLNTTSTFTGTITTCSISSPGTSAALNAVCTITSLTAGGAVSFNGTFTVGIVVPGDYLIQVNDNNGGGSLAQATLVVDTGPVLKLTPSKGSIGTSVQFSGTWFQPSDSSCSVSSPTNGAIIVNGGCSTFPVQNATGVPSGHHGFFTQNVTGSFEVGNVPEGQYVIQVSGNQGDFAQAIFNVTQGAFIQLGVNGVFLPKGQVVSGPIGTHVEIEGSQFLSNDAFNSATCSVGSPTSGSIIVNGACSFFKAPNGFVNATGSFDVGNVPEGQYVIQVSGNAGDSAQAVFNVTAGAFIQLGVNGVFLPKGQVVSGPIGTHVEIEGSQFLSNDAFNSATCSIGSPTNGAIIVNGACSFFKAPSGFVNATGSFEVGNVPEGQYVIQVSGSAGDSAEAVFNVTHGAFIQLGVNGVFQHIGVVVSGPVGTHVEIEGSNFLSNDAFNSATCSIGSPTSGSVVVNGGCSFFKTPGGFVNATGSFVVGNVPEGQYVIQVSGNAGDSAQAVFNVTAGAFIQLAGSNGQFVKVGQVASGPTGTHVNIEGSQFLSNDAFNSATCSIGSPTNGAIIVNGACSFFKAPSGFVNATGSFEVGNVPEGQYVIQVSGSAGDSAEAVFNVTHGSFIQLGVNGVFQHIGQVVSGPTGTHVEIQGSNFLSNDAFNSATCSIGSPTSGSIVVNGACSFFKTPSDSVNATGSFVVGNVPEGQYVIQVSGSAGDSAEAVFNVTAGAFIQLAGSNGQFVKVGQVASGPIGTDVRIDGSQFLSNDAFNSATCSVGSPTNGAIIVNGACSFFKTPSGFVNATGSFEIGNVPEGQYVIQVSGSAGDSAQAVFNVTHGSFIQLGVNGVFQHIGQVVSGPTGTHVEIEGSNFLSNDAFNSATCSVGSPTNGAIIVNGACSFFKTPGGFVNATGSFVVGNVPEGQYVIQVSGSAGDSAQAVFNVTQGAFIQLGVNGVFQHIGQVVSGPVGTHVEIEGSQFLSNDAFNSATCSVGSPTSGSIVVNGACSFFKAPSGFVNATGSFVVGNVPEGQYVIQVSGAAGDSAQAVFNVTEGAFIQLGVFKPTAGKIVFSSVGQVTSGPTGTDVSIEGSQFLPNDAFNSATCSISSPTSGSIIVSSACSFFKTPNGFANATGSFTVGNVLPGQFVIQLSGSAGDSAQEIFNVTSGPRITLSPASGRPGIDVIVNGTGFLPTDTSCTISSPSSGSIILNAGCSVNAGSRTPAGSFIVGNVLPGQYVIEVTGCGGNTGCTPSSGDFATDVFNVTTGPRITMSPASGPLGIHVVVNGTGFLPTDTSCTLSSPTSSGIILSGACFVNAGSGKPGASFFVGNVLPGQYVIEVTGCGGNTGCTPSSGDFATDLFNVTLGAKIGLSPGTTSPGVDVIVNGTGFLPTDQSCTISSPSSAAVLAGSTACVKQAGSTIISGSFIVGGVLPGQYVIEVTGCGGNVGCSPSVGDFAQVILNVTRGPKLGLSPGSGVIGNSILVNGTGFLTTDQSCSISSISNPNPILVGSSACVLTIGTGITRGSFIITDVPPGEYVIEVTGCAGNNGCTPSVGDFAQDILTVTPQPSTLALFPTNATNGATVTFRGTGYSASDTGCIVEAGAYANHKFTSDTTLITASTCSIVTPTVTQGSFVVGPYATEDINWTVQVMGTPANDIELAVFNVTASVVVTPTSGTINTVFTFTGSGFSSEATKCSATIIPPFPGGSNPGCYLSSTTGQVSGSVIVPLNTPSGTYGINVGDNDGHNATGIFTVGTPSALVVLNPASVAQGQPVGVAGFGFNPNDTFCEISGGSGQSPPGPPFAAGPTCAISGGYVSGSFTVANNAPGGYYLITITGYTGAGNKTRADFASNFLGVTLAATITTFSTSTTSTSTITSLTTSTTSVATTFSFSSTTYSTTGILYTTYTHFTVNTVSGMTTTIYTQTSTTTQSQTTVTFSTTTQFTTVPCGPLPCGFSTQPTPFNLAPGIDSAGLLAALLLLIPMLLRRLFT